MTLCIVINKKGYNDQFFFKLFSNIQKYINWTNKNIISFVNKLNYTIGSLEHVLLLLHNLHNCK